MPEFLRNEPSSASAAGPEGIAKAREGIEEEGFSTQVYVDTLGRKYPVDVFGQRIRKSHRPEWMPQADWSGLSVKKKCEFSSSYKEHIDSKKADAVPVEIISQVTDDWNKIEAIMTGFEDSLVVEYNRQNKAADACASPEGPKRNVSDPGGYHHSSLF